MANLQVKNVPVDLHRTLRARARQEGRTLRDLVLEAVQRDLARQRFAARLRQRAPVDLGRPAARALAEARAGTDPRRRP